MYRPYYFLFFVVISLFIGCQNDASLPVSEDEIVAVLADVLVAEAAMEPVSGAVKDSIGDIYYDQILKKHSMEREVFDTCYAILKRNPQLMESIFAKVTERLEAQTPGPKDKNKGRVPPLKGVPN